MLSKRVLDALREQFHEEFGELSERDSYIKRMKADAFALIGSMTPNDRRLRCEVDDAINGIVSASSLLGFYNFVSTPVIARDNGGRSVWAYMPFK